MATVDRWSTRLDRAVTALRASASQGRSSPAILRRHVPTVERQLKRCAEHSVLNDLWATSRNYDENAKATIVAPEIIRMIADIVGRRPTTKTFHAGYLHTYGYLFSTLVTPYGLKRDRWIQPTLDARFGFGRATLRIHPYKGTLLMNLTWLLGALVFDREARAHGRLETLKEHLPDTLRRLTRRRLTRHRIVERPTRAGTEIITDIFRLKGGHVLVYSCHDLQSGQRRLFTVFPIGQQARADLLDPDRFGARRRDLKLRYNAVIDGLNDRELRGERRLITTTVGA